MEWIIGIIIFFLKLTAAIASLVGFPMSYVYLSTGIKKKNNQTILLGCIAILISFLCAYFVLMWQSNPNDQLLLING
jgi:ABC-type proline/glycine betaine transport system permease subunit